MPRASHMHEPASDLSPHAPDPSNETIVLDREGVRRVDRAAIEEYGIPGMVLMENAARGLLIHAMDMLSQRNEPSRARVLIVCGTGNNGGDGYALARHLHNHGHDIVLAALGQPAPDSDAQRNRAICHHMQLAAQRLSDVAQDRDYDLIVDAIFGTGLDRPVTGEAARAIQWINAAERPTLAVDVPSGMDCDTGQPLGACVQATRTVTFVGLKAGFLELDAQKPLGDVHIADIGAPREVIERFGRRVRLPRNLRERERVADTTEAAPQRD